MPKKTPYAGEPKVDVVETTPTSTIKRRKLQSLIDARLIYDGPETGEHYEWSGAGAVVDVNDLDVSTLLAKRLGGTTCCGSQEGNKIFKLIGE